MSQAHWHTLADGSKVGWEGTGGVPFYVLDAEAGTIRLPDLRGMYAEVAGFDGLEVAGVHGDAVREITGSAGRAIWAGDDSERYGSMWSQVTANAARVGTGATAWNTARVGMQASLAVPTANKNQPRAFGVNAFVYLGIPRV